MSRFPVWLRRQISHGGLFDETQTILTSQVLETVCRNARCPNIGECYARGTATFLILGNVCTRACGFCAIRHGRPLAVDEEEPSRLAEAVRQLKLRFVVITAVARDDLQDGGASHFAKAIEAVRSLDPTIGIEVLTSDFRGSASAIETVVSRRPDVFNHNVETVPRLSPTVRPQARYERSLSVLEIAKRLNPQLKTKSGLMVGLGETADEVWQAMRDLRHVGCDFFTIGQYLQSDVRKLDVVEYVTPAQFDAYRQMADRAGFLGVASGPFIRSSYLAETLFAQAQRRN